MKLKIFSDKSFLPKEIDHVQMLFPFWGKNYENHEPLRSGCYEPYIERGHSFFEMVPLAEADLAVVPHSCNPTDEVQQKLAIQFYEKVNPADKPLAIFIKGDYSANNLLKNTIVINHHLYHSQQKSNEFAIPVWSQDLATTYLDSQIHIRQKQAKPVVGFCGYAPPLGMPFNQRKLKASFRWVAHQLGLTKFRPNLTGFAARARALHFLSKSSLVSANLLIRDQFAFDYRGVLLPGGDQNSALKSRQEFISNMLESDYILCARGAANCSIRFYESLSCGRIPILIDTDCVLPYDFAIAWKDYCVWVNETDISHVAEKVAEFHDRLSPKDFIDLQYECRQLWNRWVSPEGYFANFYRHLDPVGGVSHGSQNTHQQVAKC